MAKQSQKASPKSGSADAGSPAEKKGGAIASADALFARGSYAGLRKLAASAKDLEGSDRAHVDELVGRTRLDPIQVAIGGVAVLIVLIVGALTLS